MDQSHETVFEWVAKRPGQKVTFDEACRELRFADDELNDILMGLRGCADYAVISDRCFPIAFEVSADAPEAWQHYLRQKNGPHCPKCGAPLEPVNALGCPNPKCDHLERAN